MKKITFSTLLLFTFSLAFGQYNVLLNFTQTNGQSPFGSLIYDGTYLYGMTSAGGSSSGGTVFRIKPDGTGDSLLVNFVYNDTARGYDPQGSLTTDGTYLYGMTLYGGVTNDGVIFKVKKNGTGFVKLLNFGGALGRQPHGTPYYDGKYLYGMTEIGGVNGVGVIFRIKPDGTGDTILHAFASSYDGGNPWGSLISDGKYLYGMTYGGGAYSFGVVFKIKPNGTNDSTILSLENPIGMVPYGDLLFDGTYLYGMTQQGGPSGDGTIFRVKPNGTGDSAIFNFSGTNGQGPLSSVVTDGTYLYGMTYTGGVGGTGVLFKTKKNGSGYVKLVDFNCPSTGCSPGGNLLIDSTMLYGTGAGGGSKDYGVVFGLPRCTPITHTQSPTICQGKSIKVGKHTYNKTGTYHDTITYSGGCDSLITTNLTVTAVDTSVSIILSTLTSNQNSATYQWIDCGHGYKPIVGATNQTYGPIVSGSYAVIVTVSGCTDTSKCYPIILTGIQNIANDTKISIYPNPNNGSFTIASGNKIAGRFSIYNELGECVSAFDLNASNNFSFNVTGLADGVYILKGNNPDYLIVQKVIVTK